MNIRNSTTIWLAAADSIVNLLPSMNKGEYTMAQNPIVTIEMENGDIIKAELYPEIAPNTVKNFISLVKKGYYDGLIFHRVINGFMIQGGCPDGTGMGGPGYSIKGEFAQNGFANDLKHTEGVLSMARSMMPDSAGSQFFIMQGNYPEYDGHYASFGRALDEETLSAIDSIALQAVDARYVPLKRRTIRYIRVNTHDYEYP